VPCGESDSRVSIGEASCYCQMILQVDSDTRDAPQCCPVNNDPVSLNWYCPLNHA
jgi:hypothetical protein